jgi:hypothetical protein|tara:strand:- start:662 stop:952 length:291 start_codon:yes stop_codon:yes gene_type:complete
MALSRYSFTRKIPGGISTCNASYKIFRAVASGAISSQIIVMEEGKRLDQISGESYGDAGYWWVIAAASGIGWGMQVPPGTLIKIPDSLEKVIGLLI